MRSTMSPSSSSSKKEQKSKTNSRQANGVTMKKAPGAPKRFKSSYILFFMNAQDSIKKSLPSGKASAPAVSKIASQMWKNLSPSEREHWDREAMKDQMRYLHEKKAYKGPWEVPKKRIKKDKDAPRRNPSAFLLFCKTRRREIKGEKPYLKNTDVSIMLGDEWRNSCDELKRPFVEQEEREREVYKENMSRWKEQKEVEQKIATALSTRMQRVGGTMNVSAPASTTTTTTPSIATVTATTPRSSVITPASATSSGCGIPTTSNISSQQAQAQQPSLFLSQNYPSYENNHERNIVSPQVYSRYHQLNQYQQNLSTQSTNLPDSMRSTHEMNYTTSTPTGAPAPTSSIEASANASATMSDSYGGMFLDRQYQHQHPHHHQMGIVTPQQELKKNKSDYSDIYRHLGCGTSGQSLGFHGQAQGQVQVQGRQINENRNPPETENVLNYMTTIADDITNANNPTGTFLSSQVSHYQHPATASMDSGGIGGADGTYQLYGQNGTTALRTISDMNYYQNYSNHNNHTNLHHTNQNNLFNAYHHGKKNPTMHMMSNGIGGGIGDNSTTESIMMTPENQLALLQQQQQQLHHQQQHRQEELQSIQQYLQHPQQSLQQEEQKQQSEGLYVPPASTSMMGVGRYLNPLDDDRAAVAAAALALTSTATRNSEAMDEACFDEFDPVRPSMAPVTNSTTAHPISTTTSDDLGMVGSVDVISAV